MNEMHTPDATDTTLLGLLKSKPRLPVAELARLAGVARATAQSRLERMENVGVITGYGPNIAAAAIGYGVLAFVTLEITQGQDVHILEHLASIPEVLEVHAVTGQGDLLCRVAARSNQHLHDVLQTVLRAPGISRTESKLALHTLLERSALDLITGERT